MFSLPVYLIAAVLTAYLTLSFQIAMKVACIRFSSKDNLILVGWNDLSYHSTLGNILIALIIAAIPVLNIGLVIMGAIYAVVDLVRMAARLNLMQVHPLRKREKKIKTDNTTTSTGLQS
jgi:hypothetical protein